MLFIQAPPTAPRPNSTDYLKAHSKSGPKVNVDKRPASAEPVVPRIEKLSIPRASSARQVWCIMFILKHFCPSFRCRPCCRESTCCGSQYINNMPCEWPLLSWSNLVAIGAICLLFVHFSFFLYSDGFITKGFQIVFQIGCFPRFKILLNYILEILEMVEQMSQRNSCYLELEVLSA